MLTAKFLQWLKKQMPTGRGGVSRLAEQVGLDQGYMSKLLTRDTVFDPSLSTFEEIARKLRRPAWDLLHAIETEEITHIEPKVVAIEDRYREEWRRLFKANHPRAQLVLMNMRHQEELNYTDLISEVVRLIIDLGPESAIPKIVRCLDDFGEAVSSSRTRLRRRLTREYKSIQ